jgi:peptidoglycan/xylan/chitin deacetylase (PgdA/CDA1 family)
MWSRNSRGSLDLPDYIHKQFLYKKSSNGKKEVVKNPHYKTSEETLAFLDAWERVDPNGMNGSIILMHLGGPRKFDKLIHILPEFITKMKAKGYKFVTVSQILNSRAD